MNAWDRQPNESAAQYRAFLSYLKERSVEAAYREYMKGKKPKKADKGTGKASGAFKDWYRFFNWKKRAEEYDWHINQSAIQATVKARRNEYVKRTELYREMAEQAHEAVRRKLMGDKLLEGVKLGELIEMARYYDVEHLAEIERTNLLELRATMEQR
jgi:acyl-CoA reductase-like NAD-dependent aldehyde dehydrogenase